MEVLLEKWARFVAHWPLLIIVVWVALVAAALKFGPSLDAVAAKQNNTSSLPASAPSVQADHIYSTKFAAGQQSANKETDLLVLTDPQGISPQDVALAEQIESWLMAPGTHPAHLIKVAGPSAQMPANLFESSDRQALRIILTWDTSSQAVSSSSIAAIDSYLSHQHLPPGGTLGLTGSAPIGHDLTASIFSANGGVGSLLGLLIILVVLGIVYRSPLAALVPLITLGMALFAGPNQSAIMGFAPRQVMGTASGLSGLGRNLGFALGPALATIMWTVSGSGPGGIRAGLLLLLAVTGCGALVVAFVRSAPHRITAPPAVARVPAQEERDTRVLVK